MPRLRLPAELRFQPEQIGATSPRETVAVINRDPWPIQISNVTADGDFAAHDTNCTGALPPGSTCYVDLTFSPQLTGARTGWLTVSDNAINSPQRVRLWGRGQASVVPATAPAPKGKDSRRARRSKARAPKVTKAKAPKTTRKEWKPICRYCGSKDLAPSFIKRHDARCRKCFSDRYGSAAKTKKVKRAKK